MDNIYVICRVAKESPLGVEMFSRFGSTGPVWHALKYHRQNIVSPCLEVKLFLYKEGAEATVKQLIEAQDIPSDSREPPSLQRRQRSAKIKKMFQILPLPELVTMQRKKEKEGADASTTKP
jgi:hypothetical protein